MSPIVDPLEQITRYVRNGSDMRRSEDRPKYTAYMPRKEGGEISVYRTDAISDAEIRDIGAQYVAKPEVPLKGYCCLVASAFFAQRLNIEAAPTRHCRHANVVGWGADHMNRIVAKKLADQADLLAF